MCALTWRTSFFILVEGELGWGGWSFGIWVRFNVGAEANIPTFFSAVVLLLASILLLVITTEKFSQKDRFRFEWMGLGLGFLLLAIDESALFHELLYGIPDHLGFGSLGTVAWVIPFGLILLCIGLAYLRFLTHLDKRSFRMFLGAALLFVGGAVGFEAWGDLLRSAHGGVDNWPYVLVMSVEELLEMSGVALFVVALLRYLEGMTEEVTLSLQ